MSDIAELGFRVETQDLKKGERDLDSFGKTGERTGRKVEKFGGVAKKSFGAVALAVGSAVAAMASFGAVVRQISEFETAMSRLEAVSGAGAAQMVQMRDIARDLGSTTEFSASQAADGLNFLAMAGFNATEAMESLPAVLDLATASGMGLAQSADIASNVISGFGMAAADAANVADILAAASSRANTDVSQLGAAMSTVAPIAASLDVGIADTAAAIGLLSDAGIQGERAGTALRGVMASLAGPTTEAAGILKNLGLTIEDVNPATNDLATVMGRLDEAGLSTADAMKVFGREAASGALVLVDASSRLGEFGAELNTVDGAASKMADTMRDNLGGDIKGLQSALSGLILALGDTGLTSVIRSAVSGLTLFLQTLTSVANVIGSIVGAFDTAARGIFDIGASSDTTAVAIDNVTLALGDEIRQIENMMNGLERGRVMSVDLARAKLGEAEAIYEKIEAGRQEQLQTLHNSEQYKTLAAQIEDVRGNLANFYEAAEANQFGASMEQNVMAATGLENMLIKLIAEQQRLVEEATPLSSAWVEAQEAVEILQAGLADSTNGAVTLGDATSDVVTPGERLQGVFSQYPGSLNSASGAAIGLSGNIGAAANAAAILLSNLNGVPAALMSIGQQVDQTISALQRQNSELTYQTEQGLSQQAASIKAARDAAIELGLANGASIDDVAALGAEFDRQAAQAEALAGTNANLTKTLQAQAAALNGSGGSSGGGGGGSVSEASKAATRQLEKLKAAMDAAVLDAQTPMERFNAELGELNELAAYAASEGEDFGRAYDHALGEMNDRLADSLPLVGDVRDAFGEWMSRGFSDFKSFTSDILQSFKQMLVKMATTALQNKILIPIATGLMGGGGSGIGSMLGALGGGGAGSPAMQQALGNILPGAGGVGLGASFMGGLGSVFSGITSGGLAGGAGAIGTALSGATSSMAGLATAAGAIALPVAAAVAAVSFFSTKTKEVGSSLRLTADGASLAVDEIKKLEKSRFWGLQKKTVTSINEVADSISGPLADAYGQIFDGVNAQAQALGVSSRALRKHTSTIRINTKDMSEQEAQQAAMNALSRQQERLARRAIKEIDGYSLALRRSGETHVETLNRLQTTMAVVNSTMNMLGRSLFDLNARGMQAASNFMDGAGGPQAVGQLGQMYFQNVLTPEQQLDRLNAELEKVYSVVPATLEGFEKRLNAKLDAGRDASAGRMLATLPTFLERERLEEELRSVDEAMKASAQAARDAAASERQRAKAAAEAERERAAAAIASQRTSLERELYQLRGRTDLLRKMELEALSPANRALQKLIFSIEDTQAAASRAAEVLSERQGLQERIWQLTGRDDLIERRERNALDASNRALFDKIKGLEVETRLTELQNDATERTIDLLRNPLALDSDRFGNRFDATIDAAQNRRDQIRKEAEDAQITELKLMRAALEELRKETRNANLYGENA